MTSLGLQRGRKLEGENVWSQTETRQNHILLITRQNIPASEKRLNAGLAQFYDRLTLLFPRLCQTERSATVRALFKPLLQGAVCNVWTGFEFKAF